ncbi:multiple sugar transport system permease protein/sn-glycerol 3-phosphate transport system permease protein [Chryseomicrobium aureum]|uniref:carbohydrate ABC transporter permease n=1 Tax=Chryseomicrobium aureum TaxID=1441723 RepID=UPI001959F173|nr:carbohydrate ABC transporter permease [Chryseomicrobium aureum]MBM7707096.1 multiple sugar transport system permease protein/sn-glycerol 3-phosphate transport system permease protein [Chryseomicrobium aureum]
MEIKSNKYRLYFKHILIISIIFIMLIPFLWMLSTSLKDPKDILGGGIWFFPTSFTLEHYIRAINETLFLTWLKNSTIIATILTIGQIIVAFLAAYAFSNFNFRGREILFYFVLATMIIPEQAIMIPQFITINNFDWVNTFTGVIVPNLASGYAIFLMRQRFLEIPKELSEAASIDGCGPLRTLWHIYVPASIPFLSAIGVLLFVSHWNDYNWPLLVLMQEEKMTLPIAFSSFQHEGLVEWGPTMAIATLSMIPVLIIYLVLQKKFVEGFTNSGLKG